jgi:YfiR/HmsC-like
LVARLIRPAFCLVVVWLALPASSAPAQRTAFDEREVKAVFLFNFAQFVDWPANAFSSPEAPVVIGVLGNDPFGPLLDDVVRGEMAKGRPLIVVRFRRVEDISACHVLFISPSEIRLYDHILTVLGDQPTLTVGETDNFTSLGMIRFLTDRNRVRLEVNVEKAKAAGLTISSNLLRAARIVSAPRG